MAKLKKGVRAKSTGRAPADDLQAKAEQMSKSIVDSAQQIWMAGIGAFNRAQGEGSKLFEALVKEGMSIEHSTRRLATGRVDAVRDAVEDRVGVVRERAVDTWDRLEKVFEDRVQRALNRLGVPAREDLNDLTARVDDLNSQLRRIDGVTAKKAARKPAPAKAAGRTRVAKAAKAPAKPAARTSAAGRSAAKKPAAKRPATGRTLPRAPKPVAPQGA